MIDADDIRELPENRFKECFPMIHFAFRVMGRVLGNWPPIPPQSDYPPEVAKRLPKPSDVSRRNRRLCHHRQIGIDD
jgi:hypothetical protein